MSKLYVCIGKRAKIPYSIPAEHVRIFTVEELCYYICDRADVLDRSLMRDALVECIASEFALPELAEELAQMVRRERPLHEFCEAILNYVCYPDAGVRAQIVRSIRENETLPVSERLKKQGDTHMQQKQYYLAQKSYRNMLLREDVQENPVLVAEIYEKLGDLAALMFQYETAAYCFEKSCRFKDRREVHKKYLLCNRCLMSKETYLEWVASREEYYDLSVDVEREYEAAKQKATVRVQGKRRPAQLEELKDEFRCMVLE